MLLSGPEMDGRIQTRYEIRELLGKGGMGAVYKAFDLLMKREVAIKTILDVQNREALDLFYKEWAVLAKIVHPNIVEIYDIGEMEHEGKPRPYFVMPLLPGKSLEDLIQESSHRLTPERSIDIICQACRGLHVAHESGLVHRDIKPSNLFVMVDDSVKIIDFGIAHLADTQSVTGLKGTLAYMAPEQLLMKPPTPASDIFSLGVVAYQTVTRRRPFTGATEAELARAIVQWNPIPALEINPALNPAISQVIHKAMAKQPWHRFATAREFGEALQQALHNEPLACFDPAKVQPRIERATRSLQQGDSRFASEVLNELEAEGYTDPQITQLRRQIDHAVRHATVRQLLEGARRCLQENEFPLALRKVQEALELDPEDADALSLKNRVEKERRERKADEWLQLARQHVDNCAFGQARLALKNLLELKPTDSQALQLGAEVDRREQEFVRSQKEMSDLHNAALADWQKGQVSSALVKLEKLLELQSRVRTPDSRQTSSYQTLYEEVRTEHDKIKNAFETARAHFAADRLSEAMEVCDQYLAKYPGHALFQALRYDAEERQRQKLSAFIAETDRKVEKEPDLDRRFSILEEALRTYPGEPHFEPALRLVRDKRELVKSIVARAEFYEERGQFGEAVDQWKILQTVHSQYPGLDVEIERLMKRRDQQSRLEAKAAWVKQIDQYLESADYGRAIDLAGHAVSEFPDDAELNELLDLARKGFERAAVAQSLLEQGRELCAKGQFVEGVEALRKARSLDERNSVIRAVLFDSLLQQARSLLDSDWRAAEALVQQILELDPDHVAARSMRTLVSDRKRDEAVSQCTAQVRRLQASGELESCRTLVEQTLATYPDDSRLQQIQAALVRAAQETKRNQVKRHDCDELKRLVQHLEARPGLTPAQTDILLRRVGTVAAEYPDDQEIQDLAASLEKILSENYSATLTRSGPVTASESPVTLAAAPPPSAPVPPAPELPARTALSSDEVPTAELEARAPVKAPPLPVRPPSAKPWPRVQFTELYRQLSLRLAPLARNRTALLGIIGFLGFVLLVMLSVLTVRLAHRRGPATPPAVSVNLHTTPPGARLSIDDQPRGTSNLTLDISPGTHRLKAELDGYQTAVWEFAAKPGLTENLVLKPLPPVLRLLTDLETGSILLDDQPAGTLENGEFTLNEIPPGPHVLKVSGKPGEATVAFEVRPAEVPVLTRAVEARELAAVVAASYGGALRVQTTIQSKVLLDGKEAETAGQGSLEWRGIGSGLHELAAGQEASPHKMVLEIGAAPAVTVFLKTDRNAGTLVVNVGEDGATVFLNGKPMTRLTQKGRLRLSNLPTVAFSVRVAKDGFEPVPEQRVEIRKGEETRLDFQLRAIPQVATLQLEGATAGAEVLVDGLPAGEVQGDGTLTAKIPLGDHTVEIRKSGFLPKRIQKTFAAGQVLRFSGAEAALQPANGTLRVTLATPGATMTIRREGEAPSQARRISEGSLSLPEGNYIVTATAPRFEDFSVEVAVSAGAVRTVEVRLRPRREEKGPAPQPTGFDAWADPLGWTHDGDWLVRQGGNIVPFRMKSAAGRLSFSVILRKGKRLRWVLNRQDDRNYALFEMDKKNFYRSRVVNGKATELAKVPHGGGDSGPWTILVEVSSQSIVHSIRKGDAWQPLDTWSETARDLAAGAFGFLIPGRDEIGLANFSFQPKQ
jgi:serine/threonine protein kinase